MYELNEHYYDEITKASFKEMIALAKWLNKVHSHYPLIIGGWAVWCHTKGLGSRDIDIVFPNRFTKHEALLRFFKFHDYTESGLLEKEFFKEVKFGNKTEKIYIDACSPEDKNYLKENNSIELPWHLAMKHSVKFELEPDVFIYIPRVEIILIYKAKAVLDRRYDLKSIGSNPFIESKIWKDFYDIAIILKECKIDTEFLNMLLKQNKFTQYFLRGLKLLYERKDILEMHDVSEVIKNLLKEIKA